MIHFPRSLTTAELEFVRWVLPNECETYRLALERIENDIIVGEGRWGHGDLMMGNQGAELDLSLGMAPVVAYGECQTRGGGSISISVHDPNPDNLIEVQFSGLWPIPDDIEVTSGWTYSYWKPGMPCPATGEMVREVVLTDSNLHPLYTLAISTAKHVVWLHHHATGFNQMIAVTGFADEVFRTHQIRDAKLVTQPAKMFETLAEYSDSDLRHALLEQNSIASRKFDAGKIALPPERVKPSIIGKLFTRHK